MAHHVHGVAAMSRIRLAVSISALALIVASLAATPIIAQAGTCSDIAGVTQWGAEPANTTPVVLVHGFTGDSDSTWRQWIEVTIDDDVQPLRRSMLEQLLLLDSVSVFTFDYHEASTRWVTNERIGQDLADALVCLSESGAFPAVVVAHSMGGLATRQAVSLLDDPTTVSGLVTFGTPHLGSDTAAYVARAIDSPVSEAMAASIDPYGVGSAMWIWFRAELEACWAAKTQDPDADCGTFGGLPPLGSEAGVALQTGSRGLDELPLLPGHIKTLAVAGEIDIVVQTAAGGPLGIGWWYQDVARFNVGDTMVSVPSATHHANEAVGRTCQANLKTGYALSDDFRELLQINYDDGKERPVVKIADFACQHSNLTRTVEFTNQALGFINDIAAARHAEYVAANSLGTGPKHCDAVSAYLDERVEAGRPWTHEDAAQAVMCAFVSGTPVEANWIDQVGGELGVDAFFYSWPDWKWDQIQCEGTWADEPGYFEPWLVRCKAFEAGREVMFFAFEEVGDYGWPDYVGALPIHD